MKKSLTILVAFVMILATVLGSCGNTKATTAAKSTGLNKEGTLVVGFDAEYPPYGYMDEKGEYTGFDLELAEEACKLNGWTLVKTPINWDFKDDLINSGEIDVIWNGFTKNGREEEYEFTKSYVDNSQVIVVAKDSGITKLSDLAGKKVGVQQASAALDLLSDDGDQKDLGATFGSINQFADYNTAFTELTGGALDALAIDIAVAKYQLEKRGDGAYVILDEALNKEEYAVGAKKGNTALIEILNSNLKTLYDNGKVKELAEKYGIADMIIAQ